jgi:hypothetical protein
MKLIIDSILSASGILGVTYCHKCSIPILDVQLEILLELRSISVGVKQNSLLVLGSNTY